VANIALRPLEKVSTFRKLAAGAWGPPSDPTVYGSLELDATPVLAYLDAVRERTGEKVTATHLVGRCIAELFARHPDLNVLIRFGRFYQRESVDIFFQVAMVPDNATLSGIDLSGAVIRQANTKSTADIARELRSKAEAVRKHEDPELRRTRSSLERLPGFLLRPVAALLSFVQYSLNLAVPGLPRDAFGSAMITSVGMFGITKAWAPLFPPSHCPLVLLIGAIERHPWVVGSGPDERIEIRPILPLHCAFDHRVMDGFQAARLSAELKALLQDPSALDARDAVTG
jgi:pyruvate dehydrogenase E2 component (dihydrolipoamide acetyltransferase)